jgi:hypothetical protein
MDLACRSRYAGFPSCKSPNRLTDPGRGMDELRIGTLLLAGGACSSSAISDAQSFNGRSLGPWLSLADLQQPTYLM